MPAPGPDHDDDPRRAVLSRLTSPGAAVALLDRLIADGLVDDLIDPETPYADAGLDVARVMAAARHSDDAVAALMEAVAGAGEVEPGIALGGVALLDGNMTMLVPSGRTWSSRSGTYAGPNRYAYATDPRVGALISEETMDRFLDAILRHDAATAALIGDFGAHVRRTLRRAPIDAMQDLGDDLGAAAGRIVRTRNSILIRRGAASDDRTALAGTVVSVIGGIAVAVGTGGWGVAAIGVGAAGDVGIDAGFDRLFPADAEITALRTALGDDRFGLEMWRYLVVEALWERDRAYFGDTPPPVEIDGTLSSLSGPTIGDVACFAADPRAVDQWYSWLGGLPDDLRKAIDAIADTVNSRVAEEARLRIGD